MPENRNYGECESCDQLRPRALSAGVWVCAECAARYQAASAARPSCKESAVSDLSDVAWPVSAYGDALTLDDPMPPACDLCGAGEGEACAPACPALLN